MGPSGEQFSSQAEEDAYYQAYGYANRAAHEEAWYAAQETQQQSSNGDADPWAHLRANDAAQQAANNEWGDWYKQYSQWYGQHQEHYDFQNQQQHYGSFYAGGHPPGRSSQSHPGGAGSGSESKSGPGHVPGKAAPNAKPVLDARFEEKALYLLKKGIQEEMERMIRDHLDKREREKALKKLKFQWHPDKNTDNPEVAKAIFQFVEECKGWFLDVDD